MKRTELYKKNSHIERVLARMNGALAPLERRLIARFNAPVYPIIFIVGVQRSGTTLLTQLLTRWADVGYVSNLMARFWRAPYVGAVLTNVLAQISRSTSSSFKSDLGYTLGHNGPHEFGYFWRHWLPGGAEHSLDSVELEKVDRVLLLRELASVEHAFGIPLVFKNLTVCSLHITFLASLLPRAVFVDCVRHPLFAAQSTLESRRKLYGNSDEWLGLKPPEYTWLREKPYLEQIAGQVFFCRQHIEEALAMIPPSRYLRVDYQTLCERPQHQLERITRLVSGVGYDLDRTGIVLPSLQHTDQKRLDDTEYDLLRKACEQYFGHQ